MVCYVGVAFESPPGNSCMWHDTESEQTINQCGMSLVFFAQPPAKLCVLCGECVTRLRVTRTIGALKQGKQFE